MNRYSDLTETTSQMIVVRALTAAGVSLTAALLFSMFFI